MRHVPLLALPALLFIAGTLPAVEAKPETKPEVKPGEVTATTTTPTTTDKPAEPAATVKPPDPTAAIVAEGRYVYRQRDLDALMLIAARHAKARFAKAEEDRLRDTLVAVLLAREPLMDALATLPAAFSGPEREALLLDLMDYQAEAAKAPTTPPPADAVATTTPTGAAPATATGPQPLVAAPANGPLLIRLPPLALTRTLPGTGKRHLSLTIALFFRDQAQAQKLQDRAPLVQDAILSHVQGLPPAQFVEPNQLTLKDGITAAILAKVPDFPPDAVLIPEMEATAGDGREAAKPAP